MKGYSEDSEILTPLGWEPWPEAWRRWSKDPRSVEILAVDPGKGTCFFERPQEVYKQETSEEYLLYWVRSSYLNFCVARDHPMIVGDRPGSPWVSRSAAEVCGKSVRYLTNAILEDRQRGLPDDLPREGRHRFLLLRLAGFFFGDGVRSGSRLPRTLRFRLRRPRKIEYLKALSEALDVPFQKWKSDRYTIADENLSPWIHSNFSSPEGKSLPVWILTLPPAEIAAFWDGLKNSDGTRIQGDRWCYDSTNKSALGLIQATAHLNGLSANLTLNKSHEGEGRENQKPCWRLSISSKSTRCVATCHKKSPGVKESWISPRGSVYSASTSTGALLVRRQGKVMVGGASRR